MCVCVCVCERERDPKSTWIDSSTNDSAQGVPCSVIKPVMEAVESLLGEKLGGTIVEVWIELVNDTLKSQHCKQPRREG